MILITSIGWDVNEKLWIEHLRQKNISKVLLIRLVEDYDPHFINDLTEISEYVTGLVKNSRITQPDAEGIVKASKTLHRALEILEGLYIPYEYYEISKNNTKISIISYLLSKIIEQEESSIIDFSRGERLFIPLFLTIASLIPEKIEEFASLDFRTEYYHKFPFFSINFNPDRRGSTTIREILSFFLPSKVKYFQEIHSAKLLRSKEIKEKLPNMNPTHLKTRLHFMSKKSPGRPPLTNFQINDKDRRIYEYLLSENGLFLLYTNYLRRKYLQTSREVENWFNTCKKVFDDLKFKDCSILKDFNP